MTDDDDDDDNDHDYDNDDDDDCFPKATIFVFSLKGIRIKLY